MKGYGLMSFSRKYKRQFLDTVLARFFKIYFQKVVHKTGEVLRKKIADKINKWYDDKNVKAKPVK